MTLRLTNACRHHCCQFESRLEAALDSIRQTVTNSLGARSQPYTDHESDAERERNTMSASEMQRIASAKLKGDRSDRNLYHVGEQSQVTIPNWFGLQTSLCEGTTNEVHSTATKVVNGSGCDSPRMNLSQSNSDVFNATGHQPAKTESSEIRNVTTNLPQAKKSIYHNLYLPKIKMYISFYNALQL